MASYDFTRSFRMFLQKHQNDWVILELFERFQKLASDFIKDQVISEMTEQFQKFSKDLENHSVIS